MGLRVASVKIDDKTYPMVLNNAVLEKMGDEGIRLDALTQDGEAIKSTTSALRMVWLCLEAGIRYVNYKHDPDYADLKPLSFEDFKFLTGPDDYPEILRALTGCIEGVRNVEARLKKSQDEEPAEDLTE